MRNKTLRNYGLLLITAFIWGSAFVAQSAGMEYVGAFTFCGVRNIIAVIFLFPIITFLTKKRLKSRVEPRDEKGNVISEKQYRHNNIVGGICCGLVLCVASNLQQFGIMDASVGKAGFITALYVVLVPVVSVFLGKKQKWFLWICVALALVGLYLLCVTPGESLLDLGMGEILLLLCALCFTGHILVIDYFSPKCDGVMMSAIQFLVCGCLSIIMMFIFEKPSVGAILDCAIPILYAGVLSSGVAYTLQIVGQKGTNPTIASLIMCMESVFAAVCGWIILGQQMSPNEMAGSALMFVAIIAAQLL